MKTLLKRIVEPYQGLLGLFAVYWKSYGGLVGIVSSPFFHASLLLLMITAGIWTAENWWATVTSILPNVLGFTLGGYAIWLAWGDEEFKKLISGKKAILDGNGGHVEQSQASPYMEVSATFAHFVMVQLLALLAAIVAQGLNFCPSEDSWIRSVFSRDALAVVRMLGWGVGFWLFLYALMTALAAAMAIFRITHWYDAHQTKKRLRIARKASEK